jgi:hypothetical protein
MKIRFFVPLFLSAMCALVVLITGCPITPKATTLTTILKDLPTESYSLNFQDLKPDDILTQASYGSASRELLMDIDEICPPLKNIGYKRIPRIPFLPPRVSIPTFVQPTCPDFLPFLLKDALLEAITKSKWQYANDVVAVKSGKNAVIGSKQIFQSYASIQPDLMDMTGMKNVSLDKVFLMPSQELANGIFKRGWYGEGSLDQTGVTFLNWRDLFPPKQIGCMDPEYLKAIMENLRTIDPAAFKELKIQELKGTKVQALTF